MKSLYINKEKTMPQRKEGVLSALKENISSGDFEAGAEFPIDEGLDVKIIFMTIFGGMINAEKNLFRDEKKEKVKV